MSLMGLRKERINGNYLPFPFMVFKNGLNTISHLKKTLMNFFIFFLCMQCNKGD